MVGGARTAASIVVRRGLAHAAVAGTAEASPPQGRCYRTFSSDLHLRENHLETHWRGQLVKFEYKKLRERLSVKPTRDQVWNSEYQTSGKYEAEPVEECMPIFVIRTKNAIDIEWDDGSQSLLRLTWVAHTQQTNNEKAWDASNIYQNIRQHILLNIKKPGRTKKQSNKHSHTKPQKTSQPEMIFLFNHQELHVFFSKMVQREVETNRGLKYENPSENCHQGHDHGKCGEISRTSRLATPWEFSSRRVCVCVRVEWYDYFVQVL